MSSKYSINFYLSFFFYCTQELSDASCRVYRQHIVFDCRVLSVTFRVFVDHGQLGQIQTLRRVCHKVSMKNRQCQLKTISLNVYVVQVFTANLHSFHFSPYEHQLTQALKSVERQINLNSTIRFRKYFK